MKTPLERAYQLYDWTRTLSWIVGCLLLVALWFAVAKASAFSEWLAWPVLLIGIAVMWRYFRFCLSAFGLWDHHLLMRRSKHYHHRCIFDMQAELRDRLGRGRQISLEEERHACEDAPAHAGAGYAYSDTPTLTNVDRPSSDTSWQYIYNDLGGDL